MSKNIRILVPKDRVDELVSKFTKRYGFFVITILGYNETTSYISCDVTFLHWFIIWKHTKKLKTSNGTIYYKWRDKK